MTDVSNLDDLANAISNKSPAIRKYAQAQAAATQSQETDIQLAKTLPSGGAGATGATGPTGPSGPPGSGTGGSVELYPLCKRDFGGNVQAMIDAAPDYQWLYFEPGTYNVPSGKTVLADTSAKRGIRLQALGDVTFQ